MEELNNIFKNNKKLMISTIISIVLFLLLLIGATFAYFGVDQINSATASNITATAPTVGSVSLVDVDDLGLNITANNMKMSNTNINYYGTVSGTSSTTPTDVSLARANVVGNGIMYCDYTMTINKTATNDLYTAFSNWGNKSADQIVLSVNNGESVQTYDFNNVLTFPIVYKGRITGLKSDAPRNITARLKFVNVFNKDQTVLSGKDISFAFNFSNFSCEIQGDSAPLNPAVENKYALAQGKPLAKYIYDNASTIPDLWQSGLEGDGFRYVGSGNATSATTPSNFICFGTTDKTACKNNEDKYLYRIIGVFDDANGNKHAKLIKYKQLGSYKWNDANADVDWGNSTLSTNLNGSYFATNITYDYMQNNTWNNKIENWTWSAVNTKTYDGGPNYTGESSSNIYLHEMNRTAKTSSIGSWTIPQSKMGLMYASDYTLSLGETAKSMTTNTSTNRDTLKTGWMHQSNNDITKSESEWTISRRGFTERAYNAWQVYSAGYVDGPYVGFALGCRPVFYLRSETTYSGGSGTYVDPIIIG